MRRAVFVVFGTFMALMLFTTTALASSVHLKGGKNAKPSFTDNGLSLTASGELAELGNGDVLITIAATADVTSTCTNQQQNGFRHLDLPLEGLAREYDLGWKFEPNTDGPPGYDGEQYLLLYVSFRMTTGELRTRETLHYAVTRSLWQDEIAVSDGDRDR